GFPEALRLRDESRRGRVVDEIVDKAGLREDRFGDGKPVGEPLGADRRRIHEEIPRPASRELFHGDHFHRLVERLRQGLRPLRVSAGDLDLRALSQQHVDDGPRGAPRSDHKGRPISDPQTEGPQRKSETEHFRIVAFRPSGSDEHGVDRPATTLRPPDAYWISWPQSSARARVIVPAIPVPMTTLPAFRDARDRMRSTSWMTDSMVATGTATFATSPMAAHDSRASCTSDKSAGFAK